MVVETSFRASFHLAFQIPESSSQICVGLSLLAEQGRQILFGLRIGGFRRVESDSLLRVVIQKLADTLPEDGANQDGGIKHYHLNGPQLFCAGGATP